MDSTEGEWGIFEDCWARYKRMTGLTDAEGVRDELRESCMKQLITRLVQMHNTGTLGSCNNVQLLRFIEAIKDEILVLCQEILKPYLSKESINSFVGDILSTVTGNRDQLYSSILDYNDIAKRNVSSLILSYLIVISRGKPKEEICHIRLLKLVYRTTNRDCHLNLD